jgi:hypothetical protein
MAEPIYTIKDGVPQMQESFLIFIDILGYQEMTRTARSKNQQSALLSRLHTALSQQVPAVSRAGDGGPSEWYATRIFTDNLVLARPLLHFGGGTGEPELGWMMLDAARYQFNLALQGFYVRGGIAVGPAYVDDYVVFGPALIEAHDIESERAVFPRIVLTEGARAYVRKHVSFYAAGAINAPQNSEVLVDSDGEWFVNYMDAALGDDDPGLLPSYRHHVLVHRENTTANIKAFASNRRILEKYRWVGRYHNYVAGYLYPDDEEVLIPDVLLAGPFRRLSDVLSTKE